MHSIVTPRKTLLAASYEKILLRAELKPEHPPGSDTTHTSIRPCHQPPPPSLVTRFVLSLANPVPTAELPLIYLFDHALLPLFIYSTHLFVLISHAVSWKSPAERGPITAELSELGQQHTHTPQLMMLWAAGDVTSQGYLCPGPRMV